MKRYSTFPRGPELEPHHQMQFRVILKIPLFLMGFLALCWKSSAYSKPCWLFYLSNTLKIMLLENIIIILSCHQHGYPWPFLAFSPYRLSLSVGPQGYTPYPHRAAVCRFKLVALLLLGHVKGPIGVHHLWACPYFSSSVLHVWFI